MKNYEISVCDIHGRIISYLVCFDRKPLIHEAWAFVERKHMDRSCYLNANTTTVHEITIEPFEVV